jgi:hypothetical protein
MLAHLFQQHGPEHFEVGPARKANGGGDPTQECRASSSWCPPEPETKFVVVVGGLHHGEFTPEGRLG